MLREYILRGRTFLRSRTHLYITAAPSTTKMGKRYIIANLERRDSG